MTSERVPTPASIRRQDTINTAISSAEHLVGVLRGYRSAKRDGFPMAHLARIEAVLDRTKKAAAGMIADEQDFLITIGAAADEDERLSLSTTGHTPVKLIPVMGLGSPTAEHPDDHLDVPQSTAGDCD